MIRSVLSLLSALVLACPSPAAAQSEAWPTQAARLIVPFPAGGPTDVVARLLAQDLQVLWGKPVIVENKPGAGTILATDIVAKATDGHTIGIAGSPYLINPSLQPKLPYDTASDFANITQLVAQHLALVTSQTTQFFSVGDIIAQAKKSPGSIAYASPGIGTSTHLAMELFSNQAGIKLLHVPYKGSPPAQADLIAGRVQLMMDLYHSARPFVDAGKIRLIALASSQQPANVMASPLIAAGAPVLAGFDVRSLFGLIGPRGMPKAAVNRIHADAVKSLTSPTTRAKLEEMGLEVVASTPEQFDALVKTEIVRWAKVVSEGNIKLD